MKMFKKDMRNKNDIIDKTNHLQGIGEKMEIRQMINAGNAPIAAANTPPPKAAIRHRILIISFLSPLLLCMIFLLHPNLVPPDSV